MSRPARARIDLGALRHNYLQAKQHHGNQVLAVIKANAYGHGALPCAKALSDIADAFGVASLEEALRLREHGIHTPVLLMEGVFEGNEYRQAAHLKLETVIHSHWQIDALLSYPDTTPLHIPVWLKVDTGMHRLGFSLAELPAVYARLQASPHVSRLMLMTHFARADEADSASTEAQWHLFSQMQAAIGQPAHTQASCANSAGIMAYPQTHTVWGRAGIVLYGVNPFDDPLPAHQTYADTLRPVMTLSSRIIAIRDLPAGEAIGYGGRYITDKPTRVGVVACGYADGYPRTVQNGTPVWLYADSQHAGQVCPLIGRVSMDMLTIDLTDTPHADIGSEVELWGPHIPVNTVAASAGTIGYELLCNIKRVRFDYIHETEHSEKN